MHEDFAKFDFVTLSKHLYFTKYHFRNSQMTLKEKKCTGEDGLWDRHTILLHGLSAQKVWTLTNKNIYKRKLPFHW